MLIRIFVILLFYLQLGYAELIISGATQKYKNFTVSYIYDETGSLAIDDIAKLNFTQEIPNQFTLGYTNKDIWFKLKIKNKSKTSDFVLYFTEPFWAKFNLFNRVEGEWIKHQAGLDIPIKKRQIEDASPAFSLSIDTEESKIIYINAQTVNGHLGAFELFTNKEYHRPSRITVTTFYHIYSAILFIIIVMNFFLLIEMKKLIYAYYIGYVSSYLVFISMFSGSYIYLGITGWNHGLHTVGAIVLMFMSLFSNRFLKLGEHFSKINKVFKTFTFIFLMFAILMGFNIPNFTLIFNIFAFIFMTSLLVMVIKTWQDTNSQSQYYLYALIVYMPTMGMMALTFDAFIINTDFTRYSFLFGAMVEIIFFSLILLNKYNISKFSKILFQEKLLVEKEKNEQLLQEEIKKQNHELKEKNAIILQQSRHAQMGEMISMIAHQWRQPLAAISTTSIDLLMKIEFQTFDPESKDDRKKANDYFQKNLEDINSFVENLTTTIDDFRNFYKPNKKVELIKIENVIKKSLAIINASTIQQNINIIEEYNCKCKIDMYQNEMMQVILNILKNALDNFIDKQVKKPYIKIKTYEKENNRMIEICDNGGGISEDIIDKIFDPYFSTKSEKNGTGLGLYMSKTIIEDHHNGKIHVKNTEYGACFIIELKKEPTE